MQRVPKPSPRPAIRQRVVIQKLVLYLDVDGVLQYADGNQRRPRLEAVVFLAWAVRLFRCRWLTNCVDPKRSVPRHLGIAIPPEIVEVPWRMAGSEYPVKAAAICDDEDWLWLEDEPSEFDVAGLRKRGHLERLILVDLRPRQTLMCAIRGLLKDRLAGKG